MTPAIACNDLYVRYRAKNGKAVEAVNGLTVSVQPGEIVGFLGPNGAGKSSTLKALMGFVSPASGVCRIFDSEAGSIEARKVIGYLPEVAMYYPFLTPLETLTLYGELQGLRGKSLRNESLELLELAGLRGSETKLNRTLSKGMLQRVGIAQSLLGSPDLLVLDEVTSGLDPIGRRNLRELLLEKNKQGATLFFSSHELSEVAQICHRVLFVDKGKLIEERNLNELQKSLRTHALVFFGQVPLFDLANEIAPIHDGLTRAGFDDKNQLISAIERIKDSGGSIVDIVANEGSLEDYFVETIGAAA